ncbi:MAG: glucuronate isomerase [Treponemataceae bacterium]|nr:glucuronate isomerase [Treponema sp.]MDE5613261.1 glucuronate isomerase [Treponemataceae bacterium]MDE7228336.1 glucuronate isomerase [Treponemataceae bacterium]
MKKFMDKNFLLETKTAQKLFEACKDEPLWDYHCHLPPEQIAQNKKFSSITDIWLGGDHYKWRQMRTYGIDEKYITGDAEPYEKFVRWAETIENLIGNPLYHWTHLELQRYFGIDEPLTVKSAPEIYKAANELLKGDDLSVKGIFKNFHVYAVGTTDDPADSLEYHKAIAAGTAPIGTIDTKVRPSYRPDKAININLPTYPAYIKKLSEVSGIDIQTSDDVIAALIKRLDFFIENGCRASDHALEYPPFKIASDKEIDAVVKKALSGEAVSEAEAEAYKTKILLALGREYAKKNVVMQWHMNAIRDNNKAMFKKLGPDTGFDGSHDKPLAENLAALLNLIEENGGLPKTILYTLNPKDYYSIGTIMGCFQGGGIKGRVQLGSGWWFCDHRDGMEQQIKVLGNLGMIPAFVGMLTDSRSFLSYSRHEYFRRILCNVIGGWVENGEYPEDMERLTKMVKDISFGNALRYFGA